MPSHLCVCIGTVLGWKMLQKGLFQGMVAVEHMQLVEGVWKMLLSLLAKRFVLLCLLRSACVTSVQCLWSLL